jgi:hypothetical protein
LYDEHASSYSIEYTYEDLLVGIKLIFIEEEIPDFSGIDEGEQDINIEKEEVVVEPDEGKNDATDTTKPDRPWEKPVVKSSEFKANVYSLEGNIKISDPAGVIKKAPTYTMYVDNKVYSRRTFYGSGNIVISGLSSETKYYIVSKKYVKVPVGTKFGKNFVGEDRETYTCDSTTPYYRRSFTLLRDMTVEKFATFEYDNIYVRFPHNLVFI